MPNLSARLQALAEPGHVVISQATRRLIGGPFELVDLGAQQLKAFAEPIMAWQVTGESRAEGHFEAHQTAGLTPLVGDEDEIALLLRRWRRVRVRRSPRSARRSDVNLLTALLAAVADRPEAELQAVLRPVGSSELVFRPYYLVRPRGTVAVAAAAVETLITLQSTIAW